jgi:hypothetical protein
MFKDEIKKNMLGAGKKPKCAWSRRPRPTPGRSIHFFI